MATTSQIYARAKKMRREPTDAERKLWGALRNRALAGFKFYRQVPIGPYIVDFLNVPCALVIELDGATHSSEREATHDQRRTAYLQSLGLHVHRVGNTNVYHSIGSTLDGIYAVLMERQVALSGATRNDLTRRFAAPSPKERGDSSV